MSITDHPVQADGLAKKLRTTKFVRWVNPFIKARRETPSPVPTTRRVPDGTRMYCVGDIHGRDDLLGEMAERVKADMEGQSLDHVVTVFLGDYVDRGLGSMRVVERLARGDWPSSMIALAGNHEDLLTAFLEDEGVLATWRSLGGLETLHSYGVNVSLAMAGRDFRAVQTAFAGVLPERHRHFLEALKVSTAIGDYFFCHAGVRPGVPLDRQDRNDLLNIRDPFLSSKVEHGKLIVHGHTPATTPEIRPNRIGIDTAAYATGRLTCLVLEKDQRRFLQVGNDGLQRGFDGRGGTRNIAPDNGSNR
jgi:diadenosine tetraphosphatase ApaH/serine/threonine PP2A family protein phosphatase